MFLQSIRWRLPLTYAAIALFTVLALGGVLLAVLSSYYAQVEQRYLQDRAKDIAHFVASLQSNTVDPTVIEGALKLQATLADTKIRLLDVDHNEVLAVSPATGLYVLADERADRMPDMTLPHVEQTVEPTGEEVYVFSWPREEDREQSFDSTPSSMTLAFTDNGPLEVSGGKMWRNIAPGPIFDPQRTVSAEYAPRSNQQVELALIGQDQEELGYIQLLEGPAYGREIISSVAQGWLIAGGVAIVLAAVVGWLISRWMSRPLLVLTETTGRMAQGDLAVRAEIHTGGEFGALASSFNNMAARLEETVLTLRRFVADAAHELHTPLTALRTDLELITDEDDPVQQAAYANRAKMQTVRLETLTNSLLELSRIEAQPESDSLARKRCNLVRMVREHCELYASCAEQRDQGFLVEISSDPVMLLADEAQIGRVVDNLLDNAVKFTPTGGTITLRLTTAEGWAVFAVENTGLGIPPDDLPELFSRFKRGRNAVAYPGNGLGLAIVRTIVEKHGGAVAAANTADGACFTVRLPVVVGPS